MEPMNSLVVKPCLLTSVVFLGVMTLGKWESRFEVKSVHLCRVKTDISVVLTDTSGLDSHMIRTWLTWTVEVVLWFEVATSCFGGMAIPCSFWGCYPGLLFEVATSIMIMINNNIVNIIPLIKGWDILLTVVTGCFNKHTLCLPNYDTFMHYVNNISRWSMKHFPFT